MCTPQEQQFLLKFRSNGGDVEAAALAAFEVKPENALRYGRSVLKRPQIEEILSSFDAKEDFGVEELKRVAWQIARDPKTAAAPRIAALNLIAEIEDWKKGRNKAKSDNLSEVLAGIDG